MSIRVSFGSDVYAFASKDGKSYWYLCDTKIPSFLKMVGMIAHSSMNESIHKAAIEQGYTEADFGKIRTYAPIPKSRVSAKSRSSVRSSRIVSSRTPTVSKSRLSNSIKLF